MGIPATASPLEITWTLCALVALPVALWSLGDAARDLWALRKPHVYDLKILAWRDIAIDGLVSYLLIIMAIIGFRAMLLPPPPDVGDPIGPVLGWGAVGLEIWSVGIAIWLAWARHEVRRLGHRLLAGERRATELRESYRDALNAYARGDWTAQQAMDAMMATRQQMLRGGDS
jgi:hypothetical protein